jgi:AcrR family transcriptional regulator
MNCPGPAENWQGIDRRAARTRSKLHRGLMELCRHKSFENITVSEICKASGVGRSSYYAHFGSKEALKRVGLAQMRAALDKEYSSTLGVEDVDTERPLSFTQIAFEQAARHIEWHRQDNNSSGSPIAAIRDAAVEAFRRERYCPDQKGSNIAIDCFSGALDFVLRRWLDGGAWEEPCRMSKAFQECMTTVGMLSKCRAITFPQR